MYHTQQHRRERDILLGKSLQEDITKIKVDNSVIASLFEETSNVSIYFLAEITSFSRNYKSDKKKHGLHKNDARLEHS